MTRAILAGLVLFYVGFSLYSLQGDLALSTPRLLQQWHVFEDEKVLLPNSRAFLLEGNLGLNEYSYHSLYFSLLGNLQNYLGIALFGLNLFGLRILFFLCNLLGTLWVAREVYRSRSRWHVALFAACLFNYYFIYTFRLAVLDLAINSMLILLYAALVREKQNPESKRVLIAGFFLPALMLMKSLFLLYGLMLFGTYVSVYCSRRHWLKALASFAAGWVCFYAFSSFLYWLLLPPEFRYGYLQYHWIAHKHLSGAVTSETYQTFTTMGWSIVPYFYRILLRLFPVFQLVLAGMAVRLVLAGKRGRDVFKSKELLWAALFLALFLLFGSQQFFYPKRIVSIALFLLSWLMCGDRAIARKWPLNSWAAAPLLVLFGYLFFPNYRETAENIFPPLDRSQPQLAAALDARLRELEPGPPGFINVAADNPCFRYMGLSKVTRFYTGDDQHVAEQEVITYAAKHRLKYVLLSWLPRDIDEKSFFAHGVGSARVVADFEYPTFPLVQPAHLKLWQLEYKGASPNLDEPVEEPIRRFPLNWSKR